MSAPESEIFSGMGFQSPQDEPTEVLFRRYGLSSPATLRQIGNVATVLLSFPHGSKELWEGVSLVFGRSVGEEDTSYPAIQHILNYPANEGGIKFGMLLMYRIMTEFQKPADTAGT